MIDPADHLSLSGIVLCGGFSRRMGRDKASLPFGGESLLARVMRIVRDVTPDVVAVAREGQFLPDGIVAVRDAAEGLGPLAGMAAGLRAVRSDRAFVTACDLPLLRPPLIRRIFELSDGYDACVPVIEGWPMTLCAVYRTSLAELADRLVEEGDVGPRTMLALVRTRLVEADELRDADPGLDSFRDCNTPQRYAAALARAEFPG
jgi:molybdenum cofactor guanylyltransferase